MRYYELVTEGVMEPQYYATVLDYARSDGFIGFGGHCGKAAIAINRVLFDGKGVLVGALNKAFLNHGYAIGHIAVRFDGAFWDSDGKRKSWEDIESWGMIDEHDSDHIEHAEDLGFEFDEATAYEVELIEFDNEAEIRKYFNAGNLAQMERLLRVAKQEVDNGG